jgi:hypothetical protein
MLFKGTSHLKEPIHFPVDADGQRAICSVSRYINHRVYVALLQLPPVWGQGVVMTQATQKKMHEM